MIFFPIPLAAKRLIFTVHRLKLSLNYDGPQGTRCKEKETLQKKTIAANKKVNAANKKVNAANKKVIAANKKK